MRQKKPVTPSVALAKLQDLCARSEQCSHEVLTRLDGWGIPRVTAGKILALLRRDRYVDDHRYAEAFVRDKIMFNRWGRAKVRLAMIAKRIDREIIDEAIDGIDDEDYRSALIEVLRAKARTLPECTSYESRTRILRHAVSRGYEVSLVVEIIKQPSLWVPLML